MTSAQVRVLSLPVETKNREFAAKMLLAAKALERGWGVIIGKQSRVCEILPYCPPVSHLEISIPESKLSTRIRPFLNANHKIYCLCEEGIVYPDAHDYCERKVGRSVLDNITVFFANGSKQRDDILRFRPGSSQKLVVSGNPRFDLLHSPYSGVYFREVHAIQASIGNSFVLINTNFGLVNPHPSYGDLLSRMKRAGRIASPQQDSLWSLRIQKKKALLLEYRELVKALSLAGYTVVLRPHPSENFQYWSVFASNLKHVSVIHEGSANAWMLAASFVINSGCTTGLEGLMLGRPVVTYSPENILDGEQLVSSLSFSASSPNEVISLIKSFNWAAANSDTQSTPLSNLSQLTYYVENARTPSACDNVLNIIQNEYVHFMPLESYLAALVRRRRSSIRVLSSRLLRFLIPVVPSFFFCGPLRRYLLRVRLQAQKFPGLSYDEVFLCLKDYVQMGVLTHMPEIIPCGQDLYFLVPALHERADLPA